MADYRLECCGGFPSHTSDCPGREHRAQVERESRQRATEDDQRWNGFFGGMTDEAIFAYVDLCEQEIKRVEKFSRRKSRALKYLRENNKAVKYLDWKRNG